MRAIGVLTGCFMVLSCVLVAHADGPADNHPDKVRRIPQKGVDVPAEQAAELTRQLSQLDLAIQDLARRNNPKTRDLLPDIQIYHKAVSDALKYQEFFKIEEVKAAHELLAEGLARAASLQKGEAPWTTQTGLVVRGFVSKIDGTVQPYGLLVPDSYQSTGAQKHRLDIWCHGRGETLSEVNFLQGRRKSRGEVGAPDTFVLHPYGRYSNAFKFAGEVDIFEGLAHVQAHYRIDEDRIVARGFSMGGAACWQLAVHYADRFVAATPGAGFSETPEFLKTFQKETLNPLWFERKLWQWYDCTDSAINISQVPTIAYSGENDSQKQAADIMQKALQAEGIELLHLIGPKTGHSIHPESKKEIERRLATIVERGRDRAPKSVRFVTPTLKYNRMHWVTIDGIQEHWERARVDAQLHRGQNRVHVLTSHVTDLTLSFPAGWSPFEVTEPVQVTIDGTELRTAPSATDRSWTVSMHKVDNKWVRGARVVEGLRKQHNLQGPIDDAFMDSFVMVRPTGKSQHAAVDNWVRAEMEHAVTHWRQHFRGVARVVDDTSLTDAHIASSNLVLWGDPSSNAILAKIADKLPIGWNKDQITVGKQTFAAGTHVPLLIYPNPLNPQRYVVLNSGFTYREYDYLNNARQTPKLPDWVILDLTPTPDPKFPITRFPGKIAAADFFNERWQLKPAK